MSFRVVFVLDLRGGQVVHGIKGERGRYRPIHEFSKIVDTSDPVGVIETVQPNEVYIADLDRLMGTGDNDESVRRVSQIVPVMLDLGASTIEDVHLGLRLAQEVVVGTETATPQLLQEISGLDVAVSIDLKGGKVLARDSGLQVSYEDVVDMLNEVQVKSIIVLDLDRVGTKTGFNRALLEDIACRSRHPVLLGGGVRGPGDLNELSSMGLSGVLVATSIHDRTISL